MADALCNQKLVTKTSHYVSAMGEFSGHGALHLLFLSRNRNNGSATGTDVLQQKYDYKLIKSTMCCLINKQL